MIDKKQYMGGKIEVRTEYYTLVMRKKETMMAQRLVSTKFNQFGTPTLFDVTGIGMLDIEGGLMQASAATKEQQLKLLTDILAKIEKLETGVRQQVTKQRQVLGLGGASQMGQYTNLETSSAHRSTNSFMTGSRYGAGSVFLK